MQTLQLGLIFCVLVALVVFIIKILNFLMPVLLWILGFVIIAGIVGVFVMLIYEEEQTNKKDKKS